MNDEAHRSIIGPDPLRRLSPNCTPGSLAGCRIDARVTTANQFPHHPRMYANTSGATIEASDSITWLGVSTPSLPQVIFSFGTAPE